MAFLAPPCSTVSLPLPACRHAQQDGAQRRGTRRFSVSVTSFHHNHQTHSQSLNNSSSSSLLPLHVAHSLRSRHPRHHTNYNYRLAMTMTNSANTAIIVVDHGSKRQAANDMIFRVADDVRRRSPSNLRVVAAHMELAAPSIGDAVAECARDGVTHVVVVPFFLSPGRHAMEDIPELTERAASEHGVTFEVRPPIGTHPSIIDVVLDSAGIAST